MATNEERPQARVFHFEEALAILWERNKIGATDRHWWFYDVGDVSQWFRALCVGNLQPGQYEGFHSHLPEYEGPYETWYWIVRGQAEFRTEYQDFQMGPMDAVWIPPNVGHQMRNAGREPVWWLTLSSRGGHELAVDTYDISCSEDRPGYAEEYRRIMTERARRGLSIDPGVEISDASGPPREDHPEVKMFNMENVLPRLWPGNELGASEKHWWFYTVDDVSQWFHSLCIGRQAPGGSSTFHTHLSEHEGPYETWYIVMDGEAELRTEFGDERMTSFDAAFMPPDSSHQIANAGKGDLWYATLSSRGGQELEIDTYAVPSGVDRPGYQDEYHRIIAEREKRGLKTP